MNACGVADVTVIRRGRDYYVTCGDVTGDTYCIIGIIVQAVAGETTFIEAPQKPRAIEEANRFLLPIEVSRLYDSQRKTLNVPVIEPVRLPSTYG